MALELLILAFLPGLQSLGGEIPKCLKEGFSLGSLALPSPGKTLEWKEPRMCLMGLSYLFHPVPCLGEKEVLALG